MERDEDLGLWDRLLPASGAVFAVLMVVGAAAFPAPPGGDASPASQPSWLAAHRHAVIAQSYVRGFAAVAFVALAVALASALRRALPPRSALPATALIGGALSGALILLSQSLTLAATQLSSAGSGPDAIRALGAAGSAMLDFSALPAVLLFAAVGIGSLRAGILPRWLTGLSLAGVPIALIDAVSYDGGPLEAFGLIGLFFFLAWSLVVSLRLLVATSTESASRREHALVLPPTPSGRRRDGRRRTLVDGRHRARMAPCCLSRSSPLSMISSEMESSGLARLPWTLSGATV